MPQPNCSQGITRGKLSELCHKRSCFHCSAVLQNSKFANSEHTSWQSSAVLVPEQLHGAASLWDLAAAAEKTSCPRQECPGGAGCQRDRASPEPAQGEVGLQCRKRCKGAHRQKICEEGQRRKCLETKNIMSSNMEMPARRSGRGE